MTENESGIKLLEPNVFEQNQTEQSGKQGVKCLLCEKNNIKYIAKGWTGLSTHVNRGHSPTKYDKFNKSFFGSETSESPTTLDTTWGKEKIEKAAKRKQAKTLGLSPKGRIIDGQSPTIKGDKIILPLLVEFDIQIDISNAKVIQPTE